MRTGLVKSMEANDDQFLRSYTSKTYRRMGSNTGLNGTVDTLGKLTLLTQLCVETGLWHCPCAWNG